MLEELIAEEIKRVGPMNFCRFMELCLYHPRYGYYMDRRPKEGKGGDYVTAPTVSPLFGRVVAMRIAQGAPRGPFTILEIGGGEGYLALDLLSAIKDRYPEVYRHLSYLSVEVNPYRIQRQRELLGPFRERVRWVSWDEVQGLRGVVLMNEVLDALPVHRVKVEKGKLYEVFLDWDGRGFKEVLLPAGKRVHEYFSWLGSYPPEGTYAEVGWRALELLEEVVERLAEGRLFIFDYGLETPELFSGAYPEGTVRAFKGHRVSGDLYSEPGRRDLTAHVNFSALRKKAAELGLQEETFSDQASFLLEGGVLGEAGSLKERLQAKWLLLPEAMGKIFKVLILRKGGRG